MLSTILVPLAGPDLSEKALPFAVALARRAKARIRLMRGVLTAPGGSPSVVEFNTARLHEAESELVRVAQDLRDQGAEVDWSIEQDEAGWAILKSIQDGSIDLVVMSTHGRGGLGRMIYGSIAERVLRRADVPLLMIPPAASTCTWDSTGHLRLLAPLDGSDHAEQALLLVDELARVMEADIVLVRAVQPPSYWVTANPYAQSDPAADIAEARRYLDRVAGRFLGVKVTSHVAQGLAADVITDAAREYAANVIVLATHGRSGVPRFVLGSVADSLLGRATVPLALVRPRLTTGTGPTQIESASEEARRPLAR